MLDAEGGAAASTEVVGDAAEAVDAVNSGTADVDAGAAAGVEATDVVAGVLFEAGESAASVPSGISMGRRTGLGAFKTGVDDATADGAERGDGPSARAGDIARQQTKGANTADIRYFSPSINLISSSSARSRAGQWAWACPGAEVAAI